MELVNFRTLEYRAKTRLKLGEDIRIIATDTQAHRLELMKYIQQDHLSHIQVVLFDELQQSKESKKQPRTRYSHSGGIPTLQWQLAKKAATVPAFFKEATPVSRNRLYSEENIRGVKNMTEEARQYNSIQIM